MKFARLLPWLLVAFLVGVLLGCLFKVPIFYLYLLAAISIIALAVFYQAKNNLVKLVFFSLCFLLGFWRAQVIFDPSVFANLFGKNIQLNGVVVAEPKQGEALQQIYVKFSGYKALVLVSLPKGIEYFYGDQVLITGKIVEPKTYDTYNYAKFLQGQGVSGVMYRPQVLVMKTGQANPLLYKIFLVKAWFSKRVVKLIKPPEAGVILGMLIGSDQYISKATKLLFQQVGLSHVLVVSGYNISLLVVCVELLAPYLGRRFASLLGLFLVFGYAVLAGLSASVLRAAIMGSLLLFAWVFKRLYSVVPAILLAASIMVFLRPTLLLWDVGFQLSFTATLAIVLASPLVLEKYLFKLPEFLGQLLSVSLVAYVITIPLLLFHFGSISLIAPLSNLLVLPAVPIIMLMGFAVILPVVGFGAAFIAQTFTACVLWVMSLLAKAPFASVNVSINLFQFLCLIGLIIIAYFLILWSKHEKNTENSKLFGKIIW